MVRITPFQNYLDDFSKKTPNFLGIHLYQSCRKCNHDVKGEVMWRYKTYNTKIWVCRICAPEHMDAAKFIASIGSAPYAIAKKFKVDE